MQLSGILHSAQPLATRAFAPTMGLVFLGAKVGIRRVTRRMAGAVFDMPDAVAWFGVDLAVLSLSLWIGLKLHSRVPDLTYQGTVMLYVVLFTVVGMTAWCYNAYLRLARRPTDGPWYRIGLAVRILGGLFFGFSSFLSAVDIVSRMEGVR
jgi:hypothetical protein